MKPKLIRLSQRYVAALQKHLRQGPRASLQPAHDLGCQAAALDLETLDVARIHEAAPADLEASSSRDGLIKRAEIFVVDVKAPIEKTQRGAMETRVQLNQLNQTLRQRTRELAAANRRLKREIVRRQAPEEALQKGGQHRSQLLEHSRHRQIQLRPLSHPIPQPQEIGS
jgi:hypothetical protein